MTATNPPPGLPQNTSTPTMMATHSSVPAPALAHVATSVPTASIDDSSEVEPITQTPGKAFISAPIKWQPRRLNNRLKDQPGRLLAIKKRLAKHQCAECGISDDGSGSLEVCTGCHLVKYCNRKCQAAHWPAHRKACKEHFAELFDEKLFKQPPPNEDCPICSLRLPIDLDQKTYQSCCGEILCRGCVHAHSVAAADTEKYKCAFCRTEAPSSVEELIERMKKREEANDAQAMSHLGITYQYGMTGLRQDHAEALKLIHKSAKLGDQFANFNLYLFNQKGSFKERYTRKAKYHIQISAIAGNVSARYGLGCDELKAGNRDRAYTHWMISANDGHALSMEAVKKGYKLGYVTKDDCAKTIRAYGHSIDEMKSDQRDRAAAAFRKTQLTK
jgi:TPR repeat protein